MGQRGHAFISYVREDSDRVDRLQQFLEDGGVRVWRDVKNLWPGEDWQAKIREAIGADSLAFIACFSKNSERRPRTYQRSELLLAIEELRERPADRAYLMPVRLDDCRVPDLDIGGGRTLGSLTWVDLFQDPGPGQAEAERLLQGIRRILAPSRAAPRPRRGAARQAVTADVPGQRRFLPRLSRPWLLLTAAAGALVIAAATLTAIWLTGPGPAGPAVPVAAAGHRVTDSTGAVSVIIPNTWGDVLYGGWHPRDIAGVSPGEDIGPGLNASTNVYAWLDDNTTPGLFAGASKLLVADHFTPASILSQIVPVSCDFSSQRPSRVAGLTGYALIWVCHHSGTRYENVALWPKDHDYIAFLEIKIASPVDQASANRAIASFTVHY